MLGKLVNVDDLDRSTPNIHADVSTASHSAIWPCTQAHLQRHTPATPATCMADSGSKVVSHRNPTPGCRLAGSY